MRFLVSEVPLYGFGVRGLGTDWLWTDQVMNKTGFDTLKGDALGEVPLYTNAVL